MQQTNAKATSRPKALITGGAGFIGSHLAEALLDKGYEVVVLDNLSTGSYANIAPFMKSAGKSGQFMFVFNSIMNESMVRQLVRQCDVVFHLAAAVGVDLILRDPVQAMETNIFGTHVVLKAALQFNKKILMASTSEVYGKGTSIPFSEEGDALLGPTNKSRWSYAYAKAIDEFMGHSFYTQYGLPVVMFRLFNTVGPRQSGQYGMVLPRFVQQALTGKPIHVYGDGQQSRCFCDVRDVVRALIDLSGSEKALGKVFNIGSTREISILDLAHKVIERVGSESKVRMIPYNEAYPAGFEDMRRRVPDIRRIGELIDWNPRIDLDFTINDIAEYYRKAENELGLLAENFP